MEEQRNVEYNKWETSEEKQIVIARLSEVKNEQLKYKVYNDNYYINKMLIDLAMIR